MQPPTPSTTTPWPSHAPPWSVGRMEAMLCAVAAFLVARVLWPPVAFADFQQYIELSADLANTPVSEFMFFELGSRFMLQQVGALFSDRAAGVAALSYLHSLLALGAFVVIASRAKSSAITFLAAICLFGPLLTFVTLRATTAYLLVVVVALFTHQSRWRSVLLIVLAAQFHATAYMTLPLYLLASHFERKAASRRGRGRGSWAHAAWISTVLLAILIVVLRNPLLAAVGALIDAVAVDSEYGKFLVYLLPRDEAPALFHTGYFFLVLMITLVSMKANERQGNRFMCLFIGIVFAVYALLNISPVAGYRFSIFLALPALLSVREGFFPRSALFNLPLAAMLTLMFGLNVFLVLER